MRIEATPLAVEVANEARGDRPADAFTFVFGSGCCEGTAPHLFADYARTAAHEHVGEVGGIGVFADGHVRRLYDARTVVIDAEKDPLADGYSAEIPLGWRFTLRVAGERGTHD
jgi:uncharacterized protein (DUF779 family)